jgi:hypothetical protein
MKCDLQVTAPFTHVEDRELILQMLAYEDSLIHSNVGQEMYKTQSYSPLTSLTVELALQRLVLHKFGFTTSPQDVDRYRSIYRHYPKDTEVLNSVTYLRENKCLYYTSPVISVGDNINTDLQGCSVLSLDGCTEHNLYDVLGSTPSEHAFIAAFSSS